MVIYLGILCINSLMVTAVEFPAEFSELPNGYQSKLKILYTRPKSQRTIQDNRIRNSFHYDSCYKCSFAAILRSLMIL